jgi:DNA polymerase I-like protein with 3'-5' exonuclease and polymerase domains
VHDELDHSDAGGMDDIYAEMKHMMETAMPLRIPVKMDASIGPNWGDTE